MANAWSKATMCTNYCVTEGEQVPLAKHETNTYPPRLSTGFQNEIVRKEDLYTKLSTLSTDFRSRRRVLNVFRACERAFCEKCKKIKKRPVRTKNS